MMVTVAVDLSSFEHCGSGSITGRICLEIGDTRFPESDWSDFPISLLAWWLEALDEPAPVLRFMDGPFSVIVNRQLKSAQLMRGDALIETRMDVDAKDLQRSVRSAAYSVIDHCDRVGISGADIDVLRRRMQRMKGGLAS